MTLISLFLFLVLLFNPFTQAWIASQYVVDDGLEPSDAVVELRGVAAEERVRVDEARRLVDRRYAPVLLASVDASPFWGHPEKEFIEEYLKKEGFPTRQLHFCENTADSTAEEARALRTCLQQMGAKQVIIVTSEYHTRRARFICRQVFAGSGITIRIHPAYSRAYWDNHWWRRRRWAKTFASETAKFVWAVLEQGLSQIRPPRQKPAVRTEPETRHVRLWHLLQPPGPLSAFGEKRLLPLAEMSF